MAANNIRIKDGNNMNSISDWWKDYLETSSQKDALKKKIKNELEENVNYSRAYLEHSYAVQALSQKHRNILNKVQHNFNGKANQALMERFHDNIIDLVEINHSYKENYESIKLKHWFW